MNLYAYLAILFAAIAGIAGLLILTDREAGAQPALFEKHMTDCKHLCVGLQAESAVYNSQTGCSCGVTLP